MKVIVVTVVPSILGRLLCLSNHIAEHKGAPFRTLAQLHHPPYSAINIYSLILCHPIQDSNFKILRVMMKLVLKETSLCLAMLVERL